jgi:hypothetical protein
VEPGAGQVVLRAPTGAYTTTIPVGRYDLFNQFFDVRYAADLLLLQGQVSKLWRDKWVVAVDAPEGRPRSLFSLEWNPLRGGHLFGGFVPR